MTGRPAARPRPIDPVVSLALEAPARRAPRPVLHAPEAEYRAWVWANVPTDHARWERIRAYHRFVESWPDLTSWFTEPLAQRLGLPGHRRPGTTQMHAHRASSYLVYLSLVKGLRLDYEFLLGRKYARLFDLRTGAGGLGIDLALLERHRERLIELGYAPSSATTSVSWGFGRLMLHRGDPQPAAITYDDLLELGSAIRGFAAADDFLELRQALYAGRPLIARAGVAHQFERTHLARLHTVHSLLFNIGQIAQPPLIGTRTRDTWRERLLPEPCPALIRQVVERYLRLRLDANIDRPQTVRLAREALRRFINWITAHHPEITSLAMVDRSLIEDYLSWLPTVTNRDTGQPLVVTTIKHEINAVAAFFRGTASWGWADVPGRPLLTQRDSPRNPQSLPRYVPRHELDALMSAIADLPDPMQRAALLTLRWSGARRDEIRRLPLDCLDAYPDGHPRLRIPVGKGHTERMVPLHHQAAKALQEIIDQARTRNAASRIDTSSGRAVRYTFVRHGKLLSSTTLFEAGLQAACTTSGLIDEHGAATVSAHRFRHTVGTQLAEGGARIQTIMSILGHRSANMSLIYSRLSDPEVRRQYENALVAGAVIAGPAAEALLNQELSSQTLDWLQSNFVKTELELGHCLRLPAEGPCECDLILTCPKFLTTSEYAPRLRSRLAREDDLIHDAEQRGWTREIERHQCTRRRLEELLNDLGEPLQPEENPPLSPQAHAQNDPEHLHIGQTGRPPVIADPL